MERKDLLYRSGLIMLCALFVGGLVQLNRISFDRSYPPFSSLRSDPDGTKLLWDALAGTGSVTAIRNYHPLEETHFISTSVFYLGLHPGYVTYAEESFFREAERVAKDGNRLILGFTDDPILSSEKRKNNFPLWKLWNIRFTQSEIKGGSTTVTVEAHAPWRPLTDASWERSFGAGSIVLLSHVSRISNAALARNETSRQLIPLLIGSNRAVAFDEAHLGIGESGSIAGLARKYRLQGLLAGLFILAALFLWNRSVAFPPVQATEEDGRTGPIAANDTRSTLVNLLSRHIPPQDLLRICISEWNRVRPDRKIAENQNTAGKDPITMYRTIQESLTREKKWRE
jgi:hypothetical protein